MAIVLKDRVKVLATTTGTGTFTLGSAVTGYQSFSVIGDGNSTYYTIAAQATADWEVGIGTYTASGTLLSRDTILESSNGGAAVDFPAGVKDVFVTYPAERSVYLDSAGAYPVQNTFNTLNAANAVLTAGTISTTPVSGTDLVNKTYVDTIASSGVHFHTPVRVETPASEGSLNATYNNGTAGVGATLTNAGTQLALVIDGITVSVADRVLVYNQTNATQNGVYVVTNTGSGSTNWILTRSDDTDTYGVDSPESLSAGSTFFVTDGNTGKGETYTCNTVGVITFGTTNITFAQISSAQIYSAGTGLTLTNTTFSITNTGTAGTYGSASNVPVFTTNAQGQVTSVTNTAIAIAAGAVSGLAASATTDTTNASNITTGTLGTGRLSGSYAGITGVGTLAAGTWNGSTIAANYGGTGFSSYTVGDLLYSDTSSTLAKLADVAVGNALISGGVAAAPSWGKIGLATHVDGTLTVANGGTGSTTLTGYVKGTGTSALTGSSTIPSTDITGLGTMSTQNANGVVVTGGTIDGTTIGGSTAAAGTFTNLAYTGTLTGGTGIINIGSGQVYKDASGNVGIGTSAPRAPLAFAATVGTAGVPNKIRLFDDGASNFYGFNVSSGLLDIIGGTGGGVAIYTNGANERMRIHSSGGVSIGNTTDPGATNLSVTGSVTAASFSGSGASLTNVSLTTGVTGTLPVANGGTGITSLGAGVATFLGTPSSANLAAAVTGETGSGALVFATSPTLVTPALGTPSSGTLTNTTGLPIVAGTTGTLSVARGGTGATTLNANNVILGNGTSAPLFVAPSTSGNVLTSNGTTWTSSAAPAAGFTMEAVQTFTGNSLRSFTGSIPSGVKQVIINFKAITGTTIFCIQLGASSTYATSGYTNVATVTALSSVNSNQTTSYIGSSALTSNAPYSGTFICTLQNSSLHIWNVIFVYHRTNSTNVIIGSGSGDLSGVLDSVRVGDPTLANFVTSGTVSIMYI